VGAVQADMPRRCWSLRFSWSAVFLLMRTIPSRSGTVYFLIGKPVEIWYRAITNQRGYLCIQHISRNQDDSVRQRADRATAKSGTVKLTIGSAFSVGRLCADRGTRRGGADGRGVGEAARGPESPYLFHLVDGRLFCPHFVRPSSAKQAAGE
jgi:hypothetical protein